MQIITLSTDSKLMAAIRDMQAKSDARREGGLHMSSIVQDIASTLYPRDFTRGDIDDQARMYFEFGNVVEDVFAAALRERLPKWTKPVPKMCDRIWCSPDGWSPGSRTIDEIKATWKSARDFLQTPKWWVYQVQTLGYMHAWGATRARIHVFHLNGDYRPPVPHPPHTYILKPTPAEVEENWALLVRHAKDRGWL